MTEKNRSFPKASSTASARLVLALIAALALLVIDPVATGQVFVDTSLVPAGFDPITVVAADFNGDGKADVAVPNYEEATISIFLGNGNGTLQRRMDLATGPFPAHLVAADLNSDGIPDLALSVFGPIFPTAPVLSVFLGKGDGTFQSRVDYATGRDCDWVAAGDFNADGKTDLVTADALDKTLSVFLGDGDGTFQSRLVVRTVSVPAAAEVADFNGDGKADITTANESGSVLSVFLGNGDGTFQRPTQHGRFGAASSLAIADLNGDGFTDVVVGNGQVSILLGNGDGTFHPQRDFPAGGGAAFVTLGDFNGDHHLDIVSTGPETTMLLGVGNGNFQANGIYGGAPVGGGAVTDVNGDGKDDVVVAGALFLGSLAKGAVGIMLGNGDGTLRSCLDFSVSGMSAAVADFNRDGNQDLATANSLILGNGDGTFQASMIYRALGDDYSEVVAADFNRDTKPDLAILNLVSGGTPVISIYLGNGDGTFQAPVNLPAGQWPAHLITADFNGDGKPDLANTNSLDNNVSVLLGNGDGTFQPAVTYATLNSTGSLSIGDFNQDGKLDLITLNACGSSGDCNHGSMTLLLGDGHGRFPRRVDHDLTINLGGLTVSDVNLDGITDLVAIAPSNDGIHGAVAILLGNGDATFQSAKEYPTGGFGFSLVAKDFNGDHKPDLLIQEKDQFYAALLLGNGDGSFRPYTIYANAGGDTIVAADFNNDGKPDVATAGSLGTYLASILLQK